MHGRCPKTSTSHGKPSIDLSSIGLLYGMYLVSINETITVGAVPVERVVVMSKRTSAQWTIITIIIV
jgi:hypothetical protein